MSERLPKAARGGLHVANPFPPRFQICLYGGSRARAAGQLLLLTVPVLPIEILKMHTCSQIGFCFGKKPVFHG